VVVHDLDLEGVAVSPDKADAPLVVDANAVLPRPVVLQRLQRAVSLSAKDLITGGY
jgi:hypothetical protein